MDWPRAPRCDSAKRSRAPNERGRGRGLATDGLAGHIAPARRTAAADATVFCETGALEIETPTLVRAAVTDVHLESLEVRAGDGSPVGFLHTSPEYAMKRLLCAGAPDVYQVARVFREGERGRNHNPEFTMLEWYRLGIDHHALMQDVEACCAPCSNRSARWVRRST
jgi:elongation factor P--(R)-beta-lysine ligase